MKTASEMAALAQPRHCEYKTNQKEILDKELGIIESQIEDLSRDGIRILNYKVPYYQELDNAPWYGGIKILASALESKLRAHGYRVSHYYYHAYNDELRLSISW